MNKLIKQIAVILSIVAVAFCTRCSDDIDPLMTSIDADRLFSPLNLEARILNQTSVRLTWGETSKAKSYNIEFFANGNQDFSGSPVKSVTGVSFAEVPYTVPGFEGETDYSVRVQAVGSDINPSKWTSVTFKTGAEQIFKAVDPEEIQATQVTLRWPAGETATEIRLTPGDINHAVTASEIAAGAAVITGLTAETAYTAKLMNGQKTRGTVTFTTLIDLGGAVAINPGDDLKAILDAAAEGASFVIFPGEYALGEYELTKSLSLSGYLPSNKPIISGRFVCSVTVASLSLKDLNIDGAATGSNFLEAKAGCNLGDLSVTNCNIHDYATHFIYGNASVFGDITIKACIFNNMNPVGAGGGDGIDFRAGSTLASLTIENSTFSNSFRAFVRLQNDNGNATVSVKNCTFYKICTVDNSNNTGFFRAPKSTSFSVSNCIMVETGPTTDPVANTGSGNFIRQANYLLASITPVFAKNYYYNCKNLWTAAFPATTCAATEANPGFKDAANGDFTLSNVDLIGIAGDPRWW
ncbi:MAG: fibronectin type III domain-containing protein [Dysgonamonadaceae bacterium]|jgi:hypothetical protein|nr:fibronectin type III domain-containing protein [Dysgonamonadaceae bacterium]